MAGSSLRRLCRFTVAIGAYSMFIICNLTTIFTAMETGSFHNDIIRSFDIYTNMNISTNMPMNDTDDDIDDGTDDGVNVIVRTPSLSPSQHPDNHSSSFTAQTGKTFWVASPQNATFVASDAGVTNFTGEVHYLRNHVALTKRGEKGHQSCGRTLDVLAWLMDQMNEHGSRLMIAYGGLIHIHREKEFVHVSNGEYIDDDIDMWAAPEAVVHVGELEDQLFNRFGWSMRVFVTAREKFVLLMQVFGTCGHKVHPVATKLQAAEPGIEIYPIVGMAKHPNTWEGDGDGESNTRIVKDLWQETMLAESLIYPPKRVDLKSVGTNNTLHLQLPNEELDIMECLYGNWRVPSSEHAGQQKHCIGMNQKDMNVTISQ